MDDQGKQKVPADRDAQIVKDLMREMDDAHRRIVVELTKMLIRMRKAEQREINRRHREKILARRGIE